MPVPDATFTETQWNAVLCYVDDARAFFTTQPLSDAYGDDWNDVPYEHNAGTPYDWHVGRQGEPYEILFVRFSGCWREPCDSHCNSPYSVLDINDGAAPWLEQYNNEPDRIRIWAGTTLRDFVRTMYSYYATRVTLDVPVEVPDA